jgi:hypothetical protein
MHKLKTLANIIVRRQARPIPINLASPTLSAKVNTHKGELYLNDYYNTPR